MLRSPGDKLIRPDENVASAVAVPATGNCVFDDRQGHACLSGCGLQVRHIFRVSAKGKQGKPGPKSIIDIAAIGQRLRRKVVSGARGETVPACGARRVA